MPALAADFSGYAGKFLCLFQRRVSNRLFDSFIFRACSLTDAQRLFKSFLTRNELGALALAIFAG